jgi:hypothetical protein
MYVCMYVCTEHILLNNYYVTLIEFDTNPDCLGELALLCLKNMF